MVENSVILIVNTAEVMACLVMAVVFLSLPIPINNGIIKYRNSLRFLFGAYLLLGLLKIYTIVFNIEIVNFLAIENLLIAALQAILFTLTLITLINPQVITLRYINGKILPLLILLLIFGCTSMLWGNPNTPSFTMLKELMWHPTVIVREITLIFYIYLLITLTKEFRTQEKKYQIDIDNYFSDNSSIQLRWVKYCFYAALTAGLAALLSFVHVSENFYIILDVTFTVFYLFFGIYYIQYPRTFIIIEPAIIALENSENEFHKNPKRNNWAILKAQIITEKYFLRTGVNIEDMAKHLKIGRTTLSTMINSEEKVNFNTWINLLRIEEAKYLLTENPKLNLSQIAEKLGYTESSNFSRQFKLITNKSPFVWRQINPKT
jgi:AraC-like DNA-binding protein